ncbi:MAG: desulfoferrodoxin family protein [Candidatus Hodarchaeales archaeon]
MTDMNELYKSADWKSEKHAPVIEVTKNDSYYTIEVSVGKEIAHPNTTTHHIRWIQLLFQPEGSKFPFEVGKITFDTHGESPEGPDTSTVYTEPRGHFVLKTEKKKGQLIALSYCNIHGLWRSTLEL